MQLTIHRGTKEIGGSCVELQADNSRILIDFGMPLIDSDGERFDSRSLEGKTREELVQLNILPNIKGLYKEEEKAVDGILISHAHLDHYGFLDYIHPDIPVYMSQGAKELINITNIFITKNSENLNFSIIKHLRVFSVGDFTITPYLVDHSAFDAMAFLVEAEGKRVFYSGDFRGHGRKSVLLDRMVKEPPQNIDCLLMEGSMLGRGDKICDDEEGVQKRIEEILRGSNNITFLFSSSQNIDRLVSAYKACLKTGSIFVIDLYTAFILDRLKEISPKLPQFNWKDVRVKFTKYHADRLADSGNKELLYKYNSGKIEMDEINEKKNQILMLARDNSIFPIILKNIDGPEGAKIIYSMWEGYLTDKFRKYCDEKGLVIEQVHTSGHATVEDLKAFAKAMQPKILIPIHTFDANRYPELFDNVTILDDNEVFDVK
jgi:ribonuclease J